MTFEIDIIDLHKSFGKNDILKGINLKIKKGQSLALFGQSGSGKSLLLKSIIGLLKPTKGMCLIKGMNVHNASIKTTFQIMKHCGYLFQEGALFDSLTIEENIIFFAQKLLNLNPIEKRKLATTMLEKVYLPTKVLSLFPSELSGGMQKRAALARSISIKPSILFLDEPTTGLDPKTAEVITNLIIELQQELSATTVIITHDINSGYKIADRICLLKNGQMSWIGKKEELFVSENKDVKEFISPYIQEARNLSPLIS